MSDQLSIQDILRAGGVKRWHTVETVRQQTLAEHSFNVAMISRCIAKLAGMPDENLLKAALEHDLDEIINGDIPTPAKRRGAAIGLFFDQIDRGGQTRLTATELRILKFADLMDAWQFIANNAVTRHAKHVADLMLEELCGSIEEMAIDDEGPLWRAVAQVANEISNGEFTT